MSVDWHTWAAQKSQTLPLLIDGYDLVGTAYYAKYHAEQHYGVTLTDEDIIALVNVALDWTLALGKRDWREGFWAAYKVAVTPTL